MSALTASDQASAGYVSPIVNASPWAHRGRTGSTGSIKAPVDAVNGLE